MQTPEGSLIDQVVENKRRSSELRQASRLLYDESLALAKKGTRIEKYKGFGMKLAATIFYGLEARRQKLPLADFFDYYKLSFPVLSQTNEEVNVDVTAHTLSLAVDIEIAYWPTFLRVFEDRPAGIYRHIISVYDSGLTVSRRPSFERVQDASLKDIGQYSDVVHQLKQRTP